jgi:AcrR family transcriptional regulator
MKRRLTKLAAGPVVLVYAGMTATGDRRPYKKVARAERQERTQDALIEAATDEFFEGNWLKSSLQSLSAKAGVTKQTLLRNFGSKDGLLAQALMRGAAQIRDQRWSAPAGDVPGVVENLLDHYEQWGERSIRIGEWQRGPAMLGMLSRGARQVHYEWVEYAFAPWLKDAKEPARSRRRAALIALCDVQTWWIFSHDLGLERAEIHATLTDAIERLLGEAQP